MTSAKTVVWERLNKKGKWCPYSAEVCQLLEQSYAKNLSSVCLGDVDTDLKAYTINIKDMIQISDSTGAKHEVRRSFYDKDDAADDVMWQWRGDHRDNWQFFSAEVIDVIENAYKMGKKEVDLSKDFPNYPYKLYFSSMTQKNKRTKYHRPIRRIATTSYPICENGDNAESDTNSSAHAKKSSQKKFFAEHISSLWNKFTNSMELDSDESPKASGYKKQYTDTSQNHASQLYPDLSCDEYLLKKNMPFNEKSAVPNTSAIPVYALVNGKPWKHSRPPDTKESDLKPVPAIEPLAFEIESNSKPIKKGRKRKIVSQVSDEQDVIAQFTELVSEAPFGEETCIICCEQLDSDSSYDNDSTVIKLNLCSHMFHKSCIQAMYDSGPKNNCIQCPTCKMIHGVKYGIQPPGRMVYHVIPYSLPGYHECETIRIIYDIRGGIQRPEHPNPGQHYTARGFPRHCYLPDNETGRKILSLLIKAWERRLIFTIGTSSTTSEQNTVTWNEIHHKTEFGFNFKGHGYPDPHYFDNIIAELAAHGISESS